MANSPRALTPASAADYRMLAKKRLPRLLFDFIDGGAYDENTLRANSGDFQALKFRQKIMVDVSKRDTSATLMGQKFDLPVVFAPVGMIGMFRRRGEEQVMQACDDANIPMCLSTTSICPMEDVAKAGKQPFWFQLYMLKDRTIVERMLARAQATGCTTLVFTLDMAVLGERYKDTRSGLSGQLGLLGSLRKNAEIATHPGWIYDVGLRGRPHVLGNLAEFLPTAGRLQDFQGFAAKQLDATVVWDDIKWLRSLWKGKLILKGILDPEDARKAVEIGADGIVVSNHGGRQLDSVSSSIKMLPRIVAEVGGKLEILMDGGVRSGQDIAKALALGANGVMMGRPLVWALAGAGQDGLQNYLQSLKRELEVVLALTGCNRAADLNTNHLDFEL